jgi:hypothetical protein
MFMITYDIFFTQTTQDKNSKMSVGQMIKKLKDERGGNPKTSVGQMI